MGTSTATAGTRTDTCATCHQPVVRSNRGQLDPTPVQQGTYALDSLGRAVRRSLVEMADERHVRGRGGYVAHECPTGLGADADAAPEPVKWYQR